MTTLEKIDEAARNWNQTKKLQYKAEWYKLIKEFANGLNNLERRTVSTDSGYKKDAGRSYNNS